MSKALSLDLRQRALAALHDEGLSHREAAARFRVSAASISRWRALARDGADPRPGDILVTDNLSSYKGPRVRALIENCGASLLHLPPYSPDFNPIENAFSKLKALLRAKAERTIAALWDTVGSILDRFTPAECANYVKAAGYEPD